MDPCGHSADVQPVMDVKHLVLRDAETRVAQHWNTFGAGDEGNGPWVARLQWFEDAVDVPGRSVEGQFIANLVGDLATADDSPDLAFGGRDSLGLTHSLPQLPVRATGSAPSVNRTRGRPVLATTEGAGAVPIVRAARAGGLHPRTAVGLSDAP